MSEPEALRQRRQRLLEQLSRAADEISRIDSRLNDILGNRGQGGAGAA